MERVLGLEDESWAPSPRPPRQPARHDPPPPPPPPPPWRPDPVPEPVAERRREPAPPPSRDPDAAPRQVTIRAVNPAPQVVHPAPPPRPLLGPPPERPAAPPADPEAIPRFIADAADATTQIVRGAHNGGSLAFGFYPDGNIRLVDVDGGRYAGKAESARARMREVDGMRAFTVQIGVAADGRLQATFTGGTHDAETIALEPLVGWSAA